GEYNQRVLDLMEPAAGNLPEADRDSIRTRLRAILVEAIRDLDSDKLSEESFQAFHLVWQTAMDMVRDEPKPATTAPIQPDTGVTSLSTTRWSLSKLLHKK